MAVGGVFRERLSAGSAGGLVARAAAFGASWFFLPFWAFFLVALGLYFVPLFEPRRLLLPFALILYFAVTLPPGIPQAVLLGLLLFLILGVKDLVLVRRAPAYETLVILLVFLALMQFFGTGALEGGFGALLTGLLPAAALFALLYGLLRYVAPDAAKNRIVFVAGTAAVLGWEVIGALVFLPLNPFFQSAAALLAIAVLLELGVEYTLGTLARRSILMRFSVFFALEVLIFFLTPWGI